MTKVRDPFLSYARSKQKEIILFLRRLVECESPSDDPAAIARFCDLFASQISSIARVRLLKTSPSAGPNLLCDFRLPGSLKAGRILVLGHSDTVYPLGTLRQMPWRRRAGRLWGPGVLDMKSGLAFFAFAMHSLVELGIVTRSHVRLLVTSDEEIGSPTSRSLIEQEARSCTAVLVLEPGAGLEGKVKTARKGIATYAVAVHGRAAHAGVDFASGANALVELARQIQTVASWTNLRRGVTVNPGVARGGERTNVVPDYAVALIDVRVPRLLDAETIHRRFLSLSAQDRRCRLDVSGGLNRPPMERTPAIAALFRLARAKALELGVELEESSTGGSSDGNFTAALGVPTLDGLGGVGEGAHSPQESILINRIADRTALLAKLVAALGDSWTQ
jgi:glutamate carboxypeptidase